MRDAVIFALAAGLLAGGSAVQAQAPAPLPAAIGPVQIDHIECGAKGDSHCELKRPLFVVLKGTTAQLTTDGLGVQDYLLVIDGLPFEHIAASHAAFEDTHLKFTLDPELDAAQWKRLFAGRERSEMLKVALGVKDQSTVAGSGSSLRIVSTASERMFAIRPWYTTGLYIFLLVLLVIVWSLGKATDLLRDAGEQPGPGLRKPYSLARTQLALWTVAVVVSYLFIWMVLGNTNPLNNTGLILMGLSALTGLTANLIDQRKAPAAAAVVVAPPAPIAPMPAAGPAAPVVPTIIAVATAAPPASVHFLRDILSDADGVSIYRLQMLLWTLVLMFVFLYSVWDDLAMPTFDPTLLGLLGISNGTYVGFKLPASAK